MRCFSKTISEEYKEKVAEPITLIEIEKPIEKLNTSTRPDPDGLTSELSKQHKTLFAEKLISLFLDEHSKKTDAKNL